MLLKKTIVMMFSIFFLCLIVGCKDSDKVDINESGKNSDIQTKIIDENGLFTEEECRLRKLNDKVIMFESKYCNHCKKTLPIFIEACNENEIMPIILDISIDEQRKQMESYGLDIRFTPTFIFGCNHYIGAKSKEEYLSLLDQFKVGI